VRFNIPTSFVVSGLADGQGCSTAPSEV